MPTMILAFALMLNPAAAKADKSLSLKAGSQVVLELPPAWDDDTKTMLTPPYITVSEAGSIETCTYQGGKVSVKKVEKGQVYFDPIPTPASGRCNHLVTTLENFRNWSPAAVATLKGQWEQRESAFRAQLKQDVQSIIEKGSDPCAPQDKELKTGNVYKVTGRVFLYGPGTAAMAVGGGQCQVELGSFVEIMGLNRANDHAVAVYHSAAGSSGFVLAGPQRAKAATCKDGQQLVLSLLKAKQHFQFAAPSTRENLEVKGIVAVLGQKKDVCINVTDEKSAASGSRGRKIGRDSGSGDSGAAEVDPAAGSGAAGASAQ